VQKRKFLLKVLILTALIATISLGWLAGHVLRYSYPEIWHPPTRMPGEKIGGDQPLILDRVVATNLLLLQD
jgi:hypothetical protein